MAPIINAMTALEGMPSVSERNERCLRSCIVGRFRRGDAFDCPFAEARRILREFLFERVSGEGAQHSAAPRQDAEQRADSGAAQHCLPRRGKIRARRHQARDPRHDDFAFCAPLQIGDDLRETEQAHGDDHESDAVGELRQTEGKTEQAGIRVRADEAEQQAEDDHGDGLDQRSPCQHDGCDQAQNHQRKILCRTEMECNLGQGRSKQGQHQCADRAGEKRTQRGDCERRTRASLSRHRITVETSDDRRRFAGKIDQNCRRRAAVLRAVVDARQHDQGRDRGQRISCRQEHGDGRDRADAGKHAYERAEQYPDEAVQDILQRQGDTETKLQIGEQFHQKGNSVKGRPSP